jgi:hypothetical protein
MVPMNNEPNSWRDIRQNCSRKINKRWVAIAGTVLVGIVLWYAFFPSLKSNQTLEKVYFRSDGVLPPKWVLGRYPRLKRGMDLMEVDIHRYREILEMSSQIKSARIRRKFPDGLEILVHEHRPRAKACVKRKDRQLLRLVSDDGTVFIPHAYPKENLSPLPWILNYPFKIQGKKWNPIPHFQNVSLLLDEVNRSLPRLGQNLFGISPKGLDNPAAPWSFVDLFTKDKKMVRFSLRDVPQQIRQLEIIFSRLSPEEWENLQSIDASFPNPVLKFGHPVGKGGK